MSGTEWAGWISAVGTAIAAIASAVAAWQSSKSAKSAAEEAKRAQDQAEVARKQVAVERMLLAAESLSADMRRAIVLAAEIKQGATASMIASGARKASTQEMGHAKADQWQQEVKELTAIALRAASWGTSTLGSMELETVEAARVDMLRAKERVVVVLEDMERERESWQQSFVRLTQVGDRMSTPGG